MILRISLWVQIIKISIASKTSDGTNTCEDGKNVGIIDQKIIFHRDTVAIKHLMKGIRDVLHFILDNENVLFPNNNK